MECLWTDARSVFLSDLHLGWKYSNGELAVEILEKTAPQFLYLVGDTFEWLHRSNAKRSRSVNNFLDALENLTDCGTKVFILPGNHDHELATGCFLGGIEIKPYAIHRSLKGEHWFVAHGDVFDLHGFGAKSFARSIGSKIYPRLIGISHLLQRWSHRSRRNLVSHCTRWKLASQLARLHIQSFERYMLDLAKAHLCAGVICGHIHLPRFIDSGLERGAYLNCGDWVEHRSFIYETWQGDMVLVNDFLESRHAS